MHISGKLTIIPEIKDESFHHRRCQQMHRLSYL